MGVEEVTSETFRERVLNSEVPVVVDFYADWCHPCRQIAPILNALSQEHEGVVAFTKVNVDEDPELARAYRAGNSSSGQALEEREEAQLFADQMKASYRSASTTP